MPSGGTFAAEGGTLLSVKSDSSKRAEASSDWPQSVPQRNVKYRKRNNRCIIVGRT
jgi:hypothetical protein